MKKILTLTFVAIFGIAGLLALKKLALLKMKFIGMW